MTGNADKVRSLFLTALMVMSVFAGSMAFAGSAGAASYADSGANEKLDSGTTFWSGQVLWFTVDTNNTGSDNVVELYENTSDGKDFKTRIALDSEGNGTLDTAELAAGDYYLKYPDGSKIAFSNGQTANSNTTDFTIRKQTFDGAFEADSVMNDANASVDFDTNRGRVNVTVTSADFDGSGLENIFETNQVHNTSDSVTIQVSDSEAYEANFTGVATGDYDFTYTVNDSDGLSVSDNITVTDAADASASFGSDYYEVPRGDAAAITVNLENTKNGVVRIGNAGEVFSANVSVEDTNEDGQVTFYLNTYRTTSGVEDAVVYAGSEDSASIQSWSDQAKNGLSQPLAQGSYELRAAAGNDISKLDDPNAVTSLSVNARSTDSAQTWIRPSADADNVADLTDTLTQRNNVVKGDAVVVEVEASGIYGALYNNSQSTKDIPIDSADTPNASDLTLTFTESGDNVERNTDADSFNASEVSIIKDGENKTFYAVVSASKVAGKDSSGDGLGEWKAAFTVSEDYAVASDTEEVSTSFTVEEKQIELNDGESVSVSGEDTISGTTNLAPGTELNVVAQSEGVFYKNVPVTVQQDGTFSATFDFSDYEEGTEFDVRVQNEGVSVKGAVKAQQTTTTTTSTTTTTTTTTSTTSTTSEDPSETSTTSSTTSTTTDGQPGFGVAVALVALMAAALLALRRES